jgi:hypothetical protein
MTKLRTLSAVAILSVAIATPVFAPTASAAGRHHARVYDQSFRRAYNQLNAPSYATRGTPDPWSPDGSWRDDPKFLPAGN